MEWLENLHNELLQILVFVNKICKENNIKYYMDGGTLLGAVRHGGFIPWDDDIDITMPREDFNKFIDAVSNLNSSDYALGWITTNKKYYLPFAKVYKKNTIFIDDDLLGSKVQTGIFIDIFPLDYLNKNNFWVKFKRKVVLGIGAIRYYKIASFKTGKFKKIFSCLVSFLFNQKCLNKMQTKLVVKRKSKKTKYIAHFFDVYSFSHIVYPISFFDSSVNIKFEGIDFCAPSEYDGLLRIIFGDDYLILPPIEKRVSHNPYLIKFSNGKVYRKVL